MSGKPLNRNTWSSQERTVLLEQLQKCRTKDEAFRETAKLLGRSAGACEAAYYTQIHRKSEVKPVSQTPVFELSVYGYTIKIGNDGAEISKGTSTVKLAV
jgi:hypothetical protein